MLKLLLRRSGAKNVKPTVSKPAAAGELAQGELWLNNNHETPALFARADDDTLIEWKPGTGGTYTAPTPPPAPANGMLWIDTSSTPPVLKVYDSATSAWSGFVTATAAVLDSMTLADDSPGGNRFTSSAFTATPTFSKAGSPAATLDVRAKVTGNLNTTLTSGPVVTAATTAGPLAHMTWSGLPNADGHAAIRQKQMELQGKFDYFSPAAAYVIDEYGVRTSPDISASSAFSVDFTITFNPPVPGNKLFTGVGTWPHNPSGFGNITHQVYINGTQHDCTNINDNFAGGAGITIPGGSMSTLRFVLSVSSALQWFWYKPMEVDGHQLSFSSSTLTFASAADVAGFAVGDRVVADTAPTTKGAIQSITGSTVVLSPALGPNWAVGEKMTTTKKVAGTSLYCKLNSTGAVTGLQKADPGFVATSSSGPVKITFPATLPTGNAPDTDLPASARLDVELRGHNAAGNTAVVTANVTPA